ncbi:MAG: gamma-glutamyl-gamma-aminobutyrate hydrolase family protein [Terracidiphilus sp.]|nr:gamma-glutamyl-gamma-aminobutyrate hydrolase family protein [Terracidiphilus sp.]
MSVRIAIPEPTSSDSAYNQRSLPHYLSALHSAGATPVVVPLHERPDRIARLLASVNGILLPGSRYDIDPERFGVARIEACGPADPARTAADELLLQDAFNLQKPIFAICHGAQGLNVWRNGTLYQDVPSELGTTVNHTPGRDVVQAHAVRITPGTRFASLVPASEGQEPQVNSSHHQAIRTVGDNLRVAAIAPDGIVEAVELASPDQFVLAVQWHPERTYTVSEFSRALFRAFVHAAEAWRPRSSEIPAEGATA